MGMDCSETDMLNIMSFTSRMVKLAEYRVQLHGYLVDKVWSRRERESVCVYDRQQCSARPVTVMCSTAVDCHVVS
jgi:hypothetical protein